MRWLRLGLRQVRDTTETRLPLWLCVDGAQDTAAMFFPSIFTLTACGRSLGCSSHSPEGPGVRTK